MVYDNEDEDEDEDEWKLCLSCYWEHYEEDVCPKCKSDKFKWVNKESI